MHSEYQVYSPDIISKVCENMEIGMTLSDTCDLLGIHKKTLYRWRDAHPELDIAIAEAEQKCKKRCISIIQKAAINSWQAAAWFLERRYRAEYCIRTEHIGGGTQLPEDTVERDRRLRVRAYLNKYGVIHLSGKLNPSDIQQAEKSESNNGIAA